MIGLSCPGFSLEPVTQIAEKVSANFRLWEIVAEGEHFLPAVKKELAEVRETYNLELQVHAPISDINIGSMNTRMRARSFEVLWETLDTASRLGIETVTIHPGYLSPLGFYAPEKARRNGKETIMQIDKINRGYDLNICLENMPDIPILTCQSPQEIKEMIDGTDLLFCLDVGHANIANNLDGFKELKDRLGNVHVHDNHGKKDEHLTIGEGNMDWKAVKDLLSGYDGNIIIESKGFESGEESLKILRKKGWK